MTSFYLQKNEFPNLFHALDCARRCNEGEIDFQSAANASSEDIKVHSTFKELCPIAEIELAAAAFDKNDWDVFLDGEMFEMEALVAAKKIWHAHRIVSVAFEGLLLKPAPAAPIVYEPIKMTL